ncbi:LOW QUALITY PROTEIN: transient receptor potential-gamma protein-like [Centruroides vittatus]|uniref:LOW QUALITY PROTEIN: transient receptor potential-gamma protein-like n=1 Tax=Centruroides vittatus TaxID=120091 RepID=UPI00350EAA2C
MDEEAGECDSEEVKCHVNHAPHPPPKQEKTERKEGQLLLEEKKFLLLLERGDLASVRRYLESAKEKGQININCVDPLARSALLMAIDNENLEMVELLIKYGVETKDALLHAISEEYVEAVEVLLEHEEAHHSPGEPHSWEAIDQDTATFTPDVTPLILAAHRDNYEILKILLDRGWDIPLPHEVRCGCNECVRSRSEDSLRHSRSRINSFRALASPSLIALSSKDPIFTAFELSWELRRLSFMEHEFKNEYQELRRRCQNFATALLDHTRSSYELEVLLNHDTTGPAFEHGDRMHLNRLKLAIKYKQKKFCAHPNVQQLLASIWYEGLPGFRRKNVVFQTLEICRIGILFPVYSTCYIVAPHSSLGRTMRKPFIKFICHSASYVTFLLLLILASQRIETVVVEWFGTEEMKARVKGDVTTKRGATPSIVELMILAWVMGLIWSEIKQLWELGLTEYVNDMWNIIDFITNSLYVATVALRIVAYFQSNFASNNRFILKTNIIKRTFTSLIVQKEIYQNRGTAYLPREKWDAWDPMLIAEGLFAAANIFSSLKLVYIFSVNPHLGPLQISLGRMVIDIVKFFFVYTLVLFAFACGMNQLLWYYAEMEKKVCISGRNLNDTKTEPGACLTWRRFANLFESSQTLFWASFGLIDLDNFELSGIQSYTRFWGMLMFGSYCVINVVVLLNLLIAMMNHSYQMISEQTDIEWKFARSKLWMSYFEDGGTVPPPFNIIPTVKSCYYLMRWISKKLCGQSRTAKKEHLKTIRRKAKQASARDQRYQTIMRNLVRRYITKEQRKADNQGVTEDDVNEIKQDISSFRYELIEILKNSGFNTSSASDPSQGTGGKKNRQKERRLMKGFNIGLVEGSVQTATESNIPVELAENVRKSPISRFAKIARLASGKRKAKKEKWANLVDATKQVRDAFNRSRSMDSISSQISSEQASTKGETSPSDSSLSGVGSLGEETSEEESPKRVDQATNTETPALKWSRITRKLGMLTFHPTKFKVVLHEKNDNTLEPPPSKLISKKSKARRTVSAPSASLHPPQNSFNAQQRTNRTTSTSFNSVIPETKRLPTIEYSPRNSLAPEMPSPVENAPCSSPPRTPVSCSSFPDTGRLESSKAESDIIKNSGMPASEVTSLNQSSSLEPLVNANGKSKERSLGLISTLYGIEPVNKDMTMGWL